MSWIRFMKLLLIQQYTSIGGQAVIEGVMMRSPHSFIVAVRRPDGKIVLRRDQWFGLSQRFSFLKKPFLRGVVVLMESMANGVVALNYAANIAMSEELKKEALKKGKTEEQFQAEQKKKEKVSLATFLTMVVSFAFGMGLFVLVPHWVTIALGLDNVETMEFHLVDGVIKSLIFILYIYLIGLLPDIRRIFQYHGAEHKSIATFEASEDLTIENARKFSTLHPRCGTTFIFFLIFLSIIFFAAVFSLIKVGAGLPFILKHLTVVGLKILFMFPVAGISYEILKFAALHPDNWFMKMISFPGLMLQKLTTKAPDDQQLEIGLVSIKAALALEEKFNLKDAAGRVVTVEEVEIDSIHDLGGVNARLKDFLE